MEDQASELIDNGGAGVSEDKVSQVKGTGRIDLDEDEEDDFTDVAEQASLLSDFEEHYTNEGVIGSLPVVVLGREFPPHDKSPNLEASNSEDRNVQVQISKKDGTSFGEVSRSSEHAEQGGSASPIISRTLTQKNTQSWQNFSETSFMSESDEDVILDARLDAKVLSKQPSSMPMDTLGISAGKVFVSESREVIFQDLPSRKLDHVGEVMLGPGTKLGQDSGAGVKVDSTSPVRIDVKETTRRKGAIMRLGSKEAEELLQLDLTNIRRTILPSVKKGGPRVKSPKTNGIGWGVDDLGPDEVLPSYIYVYMIE